jgi:hypothetical protein
MAVEVTLICFRIVSPVPENGFIRAVFAAFLPVLEPV